MRSLFYNWGIPLYPRVRFIYWPRLLEKLREKGLLRGMGGHNYAQHNAEDFEPYTVRIRSDKPQETRPRVLHLVQNYLLGGTSRLVVDLIENLSDAFEQEIVTEYSPDPPHFLNLPITHVKGADLAKDLRALAERFKPDIIHLHYWEDDWYSTALEALADQDAIFVENVNVPVEPLRHPKIASYVYVSENVRDIYAHADEPSTVIYPGSDFDLFQPKSHPAPDDAPVIGMVYRLSLPKLSAASIEVFIEVLKQHPRARALIVGGGLFLEYYKWRVRCEQLEDRFEFTGFTSYTDLPALYDRMSLVIAPVQVESFGHVSPLGMGMGKVVIGYEIGAIPEIVGNADLIAPAGDVQALARIAVDLLNDREALEQLGEAAQTRALAQFSTRSMVEDYRALYHRLITAKGPS